MQCWYYMKFKGMLAVLITITLFAGIAGAGTVNPYNPYSEVIESQWTTPVIDGMATNLTEYEGIQSFTASSWSGMEYDQTFWGYTNYSSTPIYFYFANDGSNLYIYVDITAANHTAADQAILMLFDADGDGVYDEYTEPHLLYYANGTQDQDDWIGVPETFQHDYLAATTFNASPNTNISHRQYELALSISTLGLSSTFNIAIVGDEPEFYYPFDIYSYSMNDATNWTQVTLATEPVPAPPVAEPFNLWDYLTENWWVLPSVIIGIIVIAIGVWALMRPPKTPIPREQPYLNQQGRGGYGSQLPPRKPPGRRH